MSVERATVALAPGLDREATAADARLVASLTPALRHAVLGSDLAPGDDAGKRLLAEGLPVHGAYVTLAGGVHATFPGGAAFGDGDGRRRPEYRLGAGERGSSWGNPYRPRSGGDVLLPMSTALWSAGGELLGVAGLDVTFHYIADTLLGMPDEPAVRDAYLVDDAGRVVVRWSAAASASRAVARVAPDDAPGDHLVELAPLPFPEVLPRLRARDAGMVELGGRLVVFEPLSSLGWSYVVVADAAAL